MNPPIPITAASFQDAWVQAVKMLASRNWEASNLVVHIENPSSFDQKIHSGVERFAKTNKIIGPKHVAYTIFPHNLYRTKGNSAELYDAYNRQRGMYDRIKTSWGTYFRRMTAYHGMKGSVNQLDKIIDAIRKRQRISRAAYTITIMYPGWETIRPRGGPCLNYLAVQAKPSGDDNRTILGLLAVYRNHDFLERAYGNYWGLCNLITFLANEAYGTPGPLTCVSSRAYVDKNKMNLRTFISSI